MSNEKEVWTPEGGKTAWVFIGQKIFQGKISRLSGVDGMLELTADRFSERLGLFYPTELFPTPEAALASIKVFDIDGKEVVIPAVGDVLRAEIAALKDGWKKMYKLLNLADRTPDEECLWKFVESMIEGNEDPADPSVREITTPIDKRNGSHC